MNSLLLLIAFCLGAITGMIYTHIVHGYFGRKSNKQHDDD